MSIETQLQLRWDRAQQIDPAGIEELGLGWFIVPSSRDPSGYAVHLEFDPDGRLTVQPLGQAEAEHVYVHEDRGFGGDCVRATQQHFIEGLRHDRPFETSGPEYLKTLALQEAVYLSAAEGRVVGISLIPG